MPQQLRCKHVKKRCFKPGITDLKFPSIPSSIPILNQSSTKLISEKLTNLQPITLIIPEPEYKRTRDQIKA